MEKYTKEEVKRYKDICRKIENDAPNVLQLMKDTFHLDDTPQTYLDGLNFDEMMFSIKFLMFIYSNRTITKNTFLNIAITASTGCGFSFG